MSIDTIGRSAAVHLRAAAAECDESAALDRLTRHMHTPAAPARRAWVPVAAIAAALVAALVIGTQIFATTSTPQPLRPPSKVRLGLGMALPMAFTAPDGWHAAYDSRYVRLESDDGSDRSITIVPAGRVFDPRTLRIVQPEEEPSVWIQLHPGVKMSAGDTPYGPGWNSSLSRLNLAKPDEAVPLMPLPGGAEQQIALAPADKTFYWVLIGLKGGTVIAAAQSTEADDQQTYDALYSTLRSIQAPES